MNNKRTNDEVYKVATSLFLFLFLFTVSASAQSAKKILLDQLNSTKSISDSDVIITDDYTSKGIRHIYAKLAINQLEVYNTYAAAHMANSQLVSADNRLNEYLSSANVSNRISLNALEILTDWAIKQGSNTEDLKIISTSNAPDKATVIDAPSIAFDLVSAELKLYVLQKADLRYVWSIEIDERQSQKWKNYFVDAETGEILNVDNWTVECSVGHTSTCNHNHESKSIENVYLDQSTPIMTDSSYNVFAYPIESPSHGNRSIQQRPWLDNLVASPNGWHQINGVDYSVTKGNNVDAYLDADSSNSATNGDADRADGGSNFEFDFPWDQSTAPSDLPLPAITNLFYWNNIIHDVWYNYGFDESSGNFQEENNNGMGGAESDYVRAEAQDGLSACNANMSTPPDGGNPRMQMFLCNARDGDFDNAVIVHEYGHGISNRLTGGPSAAGCLGNEEQMGEGWSDWFGLMMTIEPGDAETDNRPIGTYLFNQSINGPGIRTYPYTTDMAVNPMTYASSFSNVSVPHGVGSVWCTMLWDMTWMMIDEYGFDADLYNGTGGNNMAMELVIEALKLQPCSPGFVEGRDAIIAADEAINGGANVCKIWEVFANRGLGYSASQGTSSSRADGNEAFDLSPDCTLSLQKTTSDVEVLPGEKITYQLTSTNNHVADQTNLIVQDDLPQHTTFVMASDAASETGGVVTWPTVDIDVDEMISVTLEVEVDSGLDPVVDDIFDDHEAGASNWSLAMSGSTSWVLQNSTIYSGSNAWKAVDGSTPGAAMLQYAFDLGIGNTSKLIFTHFYDTETAWDGGLVEISTDNGKSWEDLGNHFITNGYNNTIFNSKPGFSGNSGGFITSEIDLSAYNGQLAIVRFLMNCDQAVGGNGWYIDDVFIENLNRYIPNIATSSTDQFNATAVLRTPTKILMAPNTFVVNTSTTDALCFDSADGTATASAVGGSGTYTYAWSSGGSMPVEMGLTKGTYYCDISDGILTRRKYFFISEPTQITTDIAINPPAGAANGSATATSTGGSGSYSYEWSNGDTGSTASGLSPGTYMVTTTDGVLCETIETFVVPDLIAECSDRPFIIEIQLDQSPHELSYELRGSNNTLIASRSFDGEALGSFHRDIFCLPDRCYSLTITDSFGDGLCASYSSPMGFVKFIDFMSGVELLNVCEITNEVFEFCVAPLQATLDNTYPSCRGAADGSLEVTPYFGNYNYTYTWSNGEDTPAINNLTAGQYSVTVSDGTDDVILNHTLINGNSIVFTDQNDGFGSLREVLTNGCPMDTVTFDTGLVGDTIFLSSEILVDKSVHIRGHSIFGTFISGNNQNIVFQTSNSSVLSLETLRILQGNQMINGGAIYNQGQLILKDLVLDDNTENGVPRAISGAGSVLIKGKVEVK